ncbi:urease accessory protein UreD [Arboricoccus pini]|uniref:urease accessory protein UreD n=1 Tax=Arboricoccus pini TaxID=1963835 RepID=UPI0013FE2118|nr:urease accessory protein UreD [Arboricoccus pini]
MALSRRATLAEARLVFAEAGGRTRLTLQHIPYPFHITRPFHLGDGPAGMATLYLQSSSGGIYRDDRLSFDLEVKPGAAAHVTTQASTIVHDTKGGWAGLDIRLRVGKGAFLILAQDPLVLFPEAAMRSHLDLVIDPEASVILADGAGTHDPMGKAGRFARLDWKTCVRSPAEDLLMLDCWRVDGQDFADQDGPLHGQGGVGTVTILTRKPLDARGLEAGLRGMGCQAAASALPHAAGLVLRLLGPDGGFIASALDTAVRAAAALLGSPLAPRRK